MGETDGEGEKESAPEGAFPEADPAGSARRPSSRPPKAEGTSARSPSSGSGGSSGAALRFGLTGGAIGAAIGLVVGVLIGRGMAPKEAPAVRTAEPRSASVASSGDTRLPPLPKIQMRALRLDLGTRRAAGSLRDGWVRHAKVDGRSVSQTQGAKSTVVVKLNPEASPYAVTAVMKSAAASELAVQLNGRELGKWKVGADWEMQTLAAPAGVVTDGENTIEIRANVKPSATGDAALGVSMSTLQLSPLAPHTNVYAGARNARPFMLNGFYGSEGTAGNATVWSRGGTSKVAVLLDPAPGPYELGIRGHAFSPIAPLTVEARVNGRSVGEVSVESKPGWQNFDVPGGLLERGLNHVEFVYATTAKPSDTQTGSKDTRDLAVRFQEISVRPHQAP